MARTRPGGVNLGLQRLQTNVWWQGRSGLTLDKIRAHIRVMMRFEDAPQFIVIHIGGNDIGNVRIGLLQLKMKQFISWLDDQMPHTRIIFSQILPRKDWRFSNDNVAMDRCRRRLNSTVATYTMRNGGYYIRYPDNKYDDNFLKEDGVHLTSLGNEVFLNIIQGAIGTFLSNSRSRSFPLN